MKTISSVILIFTLSYISTLSGQQKYFWGEGQQHSLFEDRSSLVLVKKDKALTKAIENLMQVPTGTQIIADQKRVVVHFLTEDVRPVQQLLQDINVDSNDLSWAGYGYKDQDGNPLRILDEIAIKLKPGVTRGDIEKLIHGDARYERTDYDVTVIKAVRRDVDVLEIANTIYESGLVEFSAPDCIANIYHDTDPLYSEQYFLNNTGQIGAYLNYDIAAPQAWSLTTGSSSIKVAVIDDGVEDHEDLSNSSGLSRVLSGYTPHPAAGYPADGRPTGQYDPLGSPYGHGVECTGVIAASHNELDVRGIAPNVQILPVNIFSPNTSVGDIANAINWAWNNGADVLSNSWNYGGYPTGGDMITNAINNARTQGRNGKGSIVVFAAGNTGGAVAFPAYATGVICVGATDKKGTLWNYSAYGSRIDVVAPSGDVNQQGDVRTLDRMGSLGYASGNTISTFGGTSAACPQVAGVAALMLSVNPTLTETQISDLIKSSATDVGALGKDNYFGYGRVDAFKSVAEANRMADPSFNYFQKGQASKTQIASNTWRSFYSSPLQGYPAGNYKCDVYKVEVAINKSVYTSVFYDYSGGAGFSNDNPNYSFPYLGLIDNSSSATYTTYFYYIKSDNYGSINKWAPFNPDLNNGAKEYTVMGKIVPLTASISGPTCVGRNETNTWNANVSGGLGVYNYQWYADSSPIGTNSPTLTWTIGAYTTISVTVTSGSQSVSPSRYLSFCDRFEKGNGQNEMDMIPTHIELHQNSPNPFNPSTSIRFGLPEASPVEIIIYNIKGQEVRSLVSSAFSAGYHDVTWNGKDNKGSSVASGIYIYRLRAGELILSKKMIMLK